MTTSGSNDFTLNCNAVCLRALQKIGVYGVGNTVSAEDMVLVRGELNMLVKDLSTDGLHLWCREEGILYLSQYESKYLLGNGSSDAKVTLASDELISQLDGELAALATNVTVDSTTGMVVGDYIGIVLSTNDIYWTTIATIPTDTTLTLTEGVSSVASDRANVYTFTNKIYKPMRIISSRLVYGIDLGETSTKSEVIMSSMPYLTYSEMPAKNSNGQPIQYSYTPLINNGEFFVWPRPADTSYRIEFSYERIIQDLDTATDDFDFPAEWISPLVWQLAVRIAPDFGMNSKAKDIEPRAELLLANLRSWDSEIDSVCIQPNMDEC